ncbi:MAG: restriction endonuclease [Candidatus Thorarchaeota archaeon]
MQNGPQLRHLLETTYAKTIFDSTEIAGLIQDREFLDSLKTGKLIQKEANNQWTFSGFAKVQIAIRALQLGEPQRAILQALTWQEFEEFVACVFTFHDFEVHHRFRFSTNRRFEIDIVAGRNPIMFCVDCKQYGVRLGKTAALKTASEEQLSRTKTLATNFVRFQTQLGCLDWQKPLLTPLLVTMLHEDIQFHEQIPIVPAARLNAFILNFEERLDNLQVIRPSNARQQRLI